MILDVKKHKEAQDMIVLLSTDKGLSYKEAIKSAINRESLADIVVNGWASIALGCWNHASDRKLNKLKETTIEIDLDEEQDDFIEKIKIIEEVDYVTAVTYFMMFELGRMGYHL